MATEAFKAAVKKELERKHRRAGDAGKRERKYRRAGRTAAGEIPDEALNFERLPAETRVRQPVVEFMFALSAATLWRRLKAKRFPKPRRDGRINTWTVGQLRDHLAGE